jgi:hypothetical protein
MTPRSILGAEMNYPKNISLSFSVPPGRSIALMMEAARTSETSVDLSFTTQQHIPEDSELHTRCREKIKSHILLLIYYL